MTFFFHCGFLFKKRCIWYIIYNIVNLAVPILTEQSKIVVALSFISKEDNYEK
jgi:hypothetical protein